MTERKPVLTETELAAEDFHDKPRPGGPEAPLVEAPEDALVPGTRRQDTTEDTDTEAELAPGDDVVPGADR
ncbi:hypothetical protein BKD30_07435 [Tersicoccus phoenicis]|uniref:Uncharacterized protein n=1 Tax=Tersicoccus phoenicis TaxID=554083 RepID=A0A1R1LBF9_9MICC|nr:hypothetical protein [Tersicoccus phoenicis]OMH24828.1 hypothetical protein BKD30_07435 [Tersicoccus phoenicis]